MMLPEISEEPVMVDMATSPIKFPSVLDRSSKKRQSYMIS
jgi:LDH2 family malate/lactate/ureidoglycolate dehydrogenase